MERSIMGVPVTDDTCVEVVLHLTFENGPDFGTILDHVSNFASGTARWATDYKETAGPMGPSGARSVGVDRRGHFVKIDICSVNIEREYPTADV
jgi:hypothetical protein